MTTTAPHPAGAAPARTTPTGRLGQGELRRQAAACLAADPAAAHTPGAIARALGKSAGAVGNALTTLAGRARRAAVIPARTAGARQARAGLSLTLSHYPVPSRQIHACALTGHLFTPCPEASLGAARETGTGISNRQFTGRSGELIHALSCPVTGFSRPGNRDKHADRLPAAPTRSDGRPDRRKTPGTTRDNRGREIPEKESRHGRQEEERRAG